MNEKKAARLKENSRNHFDKTARNNEIVAEAVKCYPSTLAAVQQAGRTKGVLVDIGCGTGEMLKIISTELPDLKLYGVDLSPVSIETAKRNVPKASFYEGDGENIPLPDGFADVVLCMHCFHHFPYPNQALREMNRILRRGGLLILVENNHPLLYRVYKYFRFRRKKYDHGDVRLYSQAALKSMTQKAGFTNISITPIGDHSMLLSGNRE